MHSTSTKSIKGGDGYELLYEDKHVIAVNKPYDIRSVPGHDDTMQGEQKEWHSGTKRKRQDFWTSMLESRDLLEQVPERLKTHLQKLQSKKNIPRRKSKFLSFCGRSLGLAGEDVEALWAALQSALHGRVGPPTDSMLTRVQVDFPDARVVHRLDMETSGVLIFALSQASAGHIARQFRENRIQKEYIAVVDGLVSIPPSTISFPSQQNRQPSSETTIQTVEEDHIPEAAEAASTANKLMSHNTTGLVDVPLRPDRDNRPKQIVDYANGKPAQTIYSIIDQDEGNATTRLKLKPLTGRTHQLRMHCLHLGHPILGDTLYAPLGGGSSSASSQPAAGGGGGVPGGSAVEAVPTGGCGGAVVAPRAGDAALGAADDLVPAEDGGAASNGGEGESYACTDNGASNGGIVGDSSNARQDFSAFVIKPAEEEGELQQHPRHQEEDKTVEKAENQTMW
eukprot:CAMPEP_0206412888 /NCGR_PEP_ID=MMETSP0294-20121207/34322_1 /ASSEMBLY_ACC=CAM_ASM_000327 /TAXON_ID=39354 /ORGANISM="Heterosigma akashiwo, Strain CCMP2393" /LENGTH=451 /DNA_ID=CAMNT_0053874243 /DNA_START=134 /DNA_END=1486 /DNA_ORIENTATION=-